MNFLEFDNAWGLILPVEILEQLNINPEKDLIDTEIKNGGLFIKKAK